jgi:phosphoribosylformylglycinamidine cyclo-ligase
VSTGTVDGKGAADRSAYARAGVDVEAGDRAVALMRAAVASTHRPEVVGGLGGFGGVVAIPDGYREPLLVSSTDGVGTKTALARAMGRYDGLGIDLVAMCADDVVCAGAEPLFFLDYLAVGHLDPERVATIVGGVAAGCRLAGCALVGGETAEHPGVMAPDDVDLAGACTGVVERSRLLDGSAVRSGDAILGLASNGLHANGFSLVRAALADPGLDLGGGYETVVRRVLGLAAQSALADDALAGDALAGNALAGDALADDAPADDGPAAGAGAGDAPAADRERTLGDVLLTPTRIYARAVLRLRADLDAAGAALHGLAHITGGGLPGNAPRALPAALGARLDPARWPVPSAMRLIAAVAGIDDVELRATFNGGLGMIAVVPVEAVRAARASLARSGIPAWLVGEVVPVEAGGPRYVEGPLSAREADR